MDKEYIDQTCSPIEEELPLMTFSNRFETAP